MMYQITISLHCHTSSWHGYLYEKGLFSKQNASNATNYTMPFSHMWPTYSFNRYGHDCIQWCQTFDFCACVVCATQPCTLCMMTLKLHSPTQCMPNRAAAKAMNITVHCVKLQPFAVRINQVETTGWDHEVAL